MDTITTNCRLIRAIIKHIVIKPSVPALESVIQETSISDNSTEKEGQCKPHIQFRKAACEYSLSALTLVPAARKEAIDRAIEMLLPSNTWQQQFVS